MGTASGDRDAFQHLFALPNLHWAEYSPRLLSPSPKPSVIATACRPCLRERERERDTEYVGLGRHEFFLSQKEMKRKKKQGKALLFYNHYQRPLSLSLTHTHICNRTIPSTIYLALMTISLSSSLLLSNSHYVRLYVSMCACKDDAFHHYFPSFSFLFPLSHNAH